MLHYKKHWLVFFVAGLVILLDQLSKYLVVENQFFYTLNSGIAFSIPLGNMIAFIVGMLIVMALFFYGDKLINIHNRLTSISLGFVMGGAIGNLIDRMRLDAVIDFIKVPYWPAFNVADSAITVGVLIMIIIGLGNSGRRSGSSGGRE